MFSRLDGESALGRLGTNGMESMEKTLCMILSLVAEEFWRIDASSYMHQRSDSDFKIPPFLECAAGQFYTSTSTRTSPSIHSTVPALSNAIIHWPSSLT